MASVILSAVGSAIGSGYSGFSLFGVTVSGAQIGGAIGTVAGMAIDSALAPSVRRAGPRLTDTNLQTSTEGAPIPRLFGRVRVAGQVIWASRFKEGEGTAGGKGSGGDAAAYACSISFAVGLCEGPITRIGRIWADGNLIDVSRYTMRVHRGDETQTPDPQIAEIEGEANTPAYRGLAYVVFEDMPLAQFGNRIPQLQFEVVRAIATGNTNALENRLTAVALIPGAGEFVYAPDIVGEWDGLGKSAPVNAHNSAGTSDFAASLDELEALAPNLQAVTLVVGWFGDDLRAGTIAIRPGVEEVTRHTYPEIWSVDGIARTEARLLSRIDDRPAYGGTPSDDCVRAAIADLKARGLRVTFCPFLFMDVPAGNLLPDPYSANATKTGQPAYPWRGRVTLSPAAGFAGTVDQTAAAATQVNAFFNSTWGWRRMVLHYAHLCAEAGGVDTFLIGSELIGLTRARSDASTYPAVAALKQLAADVRAILPAAEIGYAADWSEYSGHQTGAGALRFNLDPLWSDANIDFIGIDNYLPLADWRDGDAHLDAAEFGSIYDPAYLASNIRGGEDYDWYYASVADRATQRRTPITDGLGKPWVWRAKDLWNWWSNLHFDRPSGTESPTHTAWVPQSKPIRFTELGCPAVDKGANQPNVFHDPKSSENALPFFSSGARDDLMQRRFLETHLGYWSDPANNPVSSVYHAPMLDAGETALWCWDARPYPFFPARADLWGDADNYATGHWLNGRLGAVQLPDLVAALCTDAGFTDYDVSGLEGLVTGFAVTDTMSVRDALGPLMAAFFFDGVESEGRIRFVMRGRAEPLAVGEGDLVLGEEGFGFSLQRAQETDLPNVSRVAYLDANEYRQAVTESRRLVTLSDRVATSSLPLVLGAGEASGIGERLLQDAWVMRERAEFSLPPSQLALDPADEVLLTVSGRTRRLRVTEIDDSGARKMEAVATDPSVYETSIVAIRAGGPIQIPGRPGRALVAFLDVPLLTESQDPNAPLVAAFADPWPGTVQVLMSPTAANFVLNTSLTRPASMGETTQAFWSGPLNRWDRINALCVRLFHGTLASADDASVFAGANALALQNADGEWEIVQFGTAGLVASNEWRLTGLLRGRRGTESAMRDPVAAGARVVLLDQAVAQLRLPAGEARLSHTYIYGPAGLPLADPAFQAETLAFSAAALVPPAPCHVRHAWNPDGSLTISWRRRDRAPAADRLTLAETPLSETLESYDLEILAGAAVVRSFAAVSQHSQIYTAAQQAADFPGGLPNPLVVQVYQRSSALGRGRKKTEPLYVR
jgi:hypothetical protein